jgi:hypothetical protein
VPRKITTTFLNISAIFLGDIEDSPALSSLMCYAARERSGQILVRAKKRELQLEKRPPRVVGCRRGRPTIVVVGGGVAGHSAIETLRYVNICIEPQCTA